MERAVTSYAIWARILRALSDRPETLTDPHGLHEIVRDIIADDQQLVWC
jgi:hypothetical protein